MDTFYRIYDMNTGMLMKPGCHSPTLSRPGNPPLSSIKEFDAGLIALGAALNVSIGYLVGLLKLPLYLDSIGTILISALCGWMYGIVVGFAALIILALTVTPTVIAYAGTVVVIAVFASVFAKMGFLKGTLMTVIGGILLGVAAAATSAPVTTFLYGGVSLAGADAITTFFKATGMPLWKSVLLGSLVTDPADKLITSLICLGLIKSLPPRILDRIKGKNAKGMIHKV
jgi:energy-coupling factor transport system substrate-specific component